MLLLQRHQLVEHLVGRIFTLEAYHHEIAHPAPPVPCTTPIQTNRTTATSFYHLCDPLCNAGSRCLHRLSGRTSGRCSSSWKTCTGSIRPRWSSSACWSIKAPPPASWHSSPVAPTSTRPGR